MGHITWTSDDMVTIKKTDLDEVVAIIVDAVLTLRMAGDTLDETDFVDAAATTDETRKALQRALDLLKKARSSS